MVRLGQTKWIAKLDISHTCAPLVTHDEWVHIVHSTPSSESLQ